MSKTMMLGFRDLRDPGPLVYDPPAGLELTPCQVSVQAPDGMTRKGYPSQVQYVLNMKK